MVVGLYARVSTSDKGQDPETQLIPLREFAAAQGWTVAGGFVDRVPPADLGRRTAWRDLLGQGSRRRVDLVLVWRIDRAFRSVLDAANTLERVRGSGVGLRSYQEPWLDTTSPFGEALYYVTVASSRSGGRSCGPGSIRGAVQERCGPGAGSFALDGIGVAG